MTFVVSLLILVLAACVGRYGVSLLRADKIEAEKNVARMPTIKDAIMGRVLIHDDWLPDARVQGGMVFNKRKNRFEICGRISDDSLNRAFRKRD